MKLIFQPEYEVWEIISFGFCSFRPHILFLLTICLHTQKKQRRNHLRIQETFLKYVHGLLWKQKQLPHIRLPEQEAMNFICTLSVLY